jgi:hypothetical protein
MEGLSSDLCSFLQDSSSSDLTLICPDGKVQVHRLMLAARSPVFNSLLNSDMQEKVSGIVKINDYKIEVVRAMVHYMYPAEIEEAFEDIVALVKIGGKYLIPTPVDDCSKKLIKSISASNVLDLGAVADVYAVLLDGCANFVAENVEVLDEDWRWRTKLKSSPEFLMNIIENMRNIYINDLKISRYGSKAEGQGWVCKGSKADAISIRLSHSATLTSIGCYGNSSTSLIPVTIIVKRDDSDSIILKQEISFKSTGSSEPIPVPVKVAMDAGAKYTISVVINSGDTIHYGKDGNSEVVCDGGFRVSFEQSTSSSNNDHLFLLMSTNLFFRLICFRVLRIIFCDLNPHAKFQNH